MAEEEVVEEVAVAKTVLRVVFCHSQVYPHSQKVFTCAKQSSESSFKRRSKPTTSSPGLWEGEIAQIPAMKSHWNTRKYNPYNTSRESVKELDLSRNKLRSAAIIVIMIAFRCCRWDGFDSMRFFCSQMMELLM